MPSVIRVGDNCTGHGAFPPRPASSGSPNVFINGRPVVRVGDSYAVHCDPSPSCHGGKASTGSATVFANGIPICRNGDSVSCGSKQANGSENVFAN